MINYLLPSAQVVQVPLPAPTMTFVLGAVGDHVRVWLRGRSVFDRVGCPLCGLCLYGVV